MRMIERENKQNSVPAVSARQQSAALAREQRRFPEQKAKLGVPPPNGISAQQFRDMRRAVRLRERPFAEPGQ